MLKAEEIRDSLAQFSGSENRYRHWSDLVFTDGIKYMAESCQAYWLIEVIASYQHLFRKDPMLGQIQLWTLHKVEKGGWELICERDSGDVAIRQIIEFSDFPLDEIKIYVANQTIMLPSEY